MTFEELAQLAVKPLEWTRAEAAEQRKSDRRLAMCEGKVKYHSEAAGRFHAIKIKQWVSVYECPYCGSWHLGNPSGSR